MVTITYHIPDGLTFAALRLARDPVDGSLTMDMSVLDGIRDASRLPTSALTTEDEISHVVMAWYRSHRAEGGARASHGPVRPL